MQPQGGGNEGTGSPCGCFHQCHSRALHPLQETGNLHRGHCQSRQTLTSAWRLCQHHPSPRLNGAEETRGLSGSEAPQISCQEVAESDQDCVRQRSGSRAVVKRAADAPALCSCCVPTVLPSHAALPSVLRYLEISALTHTKSH